MMEQVIRTLRSEDTIVHGAARGADTLAADLAVKYNMTVIGVPADWATHGKKAGPLRNQRMLDEHRPDFVLAFPTKDSIGTWDMIKRAANAGIPVQIFPLPAPVTPQNVSHAASARSQAQAPLAEAV